MKNKIYNTQFNTLFYLPLSYVIEQEETIIEQCKVKKIRVINLVADIYYETETLWQLIKKIKKSGIEVLFSFRFKNSKTLNDTNWNTLIIFKTLSKNMITKSMEFVKCSHKIFNNIEIVAKLSNYDYLLIPFYSIESTMLIKKDEIKLDINNGVYVEVANILKHMVFKRIGNVFKKQQDMVGMINEMFYPYLPKDDHEIHQLLHRVITIFSVIFSSNDYFENIMQFKRFPNAMGIFLGFSNYLKTPFRTSYISLINVSFNYLSYVRFKFDMNIDLNLYYANTYKDSPIYRIRSKLLKKFQWWANDKNMWIIIAFTLFFYINSLISFFSNWIGGSQNSDLKFIAAYFANTVTIFNVYFMFAYFSSIFTFIYNYITIKRLITILLTKNLKYNVNCTDIDLIYLIKMTNGYLVSIGLEDFLITINNKEPMTIDEYKDQALLFKYSFFAHQKQLISVFIIKLVFLTFLAFGSWIMTSFFGQHLNEYQNSLYWVLGMTALLLFVFAWSGLNVLETLIPNPTNWIAYKTIQSYIPIKIKIEKDSIIFSDINDKTLLDTYDMSTTLLKIKLTKMFTNHVKSAKKYFVIDNYQELTGIVDFLLQHKIKIYVNYAYNEYVTKSLYAINLKENNNEIDLFKYLSDIKDDRLIAAYKQQQIDDQQKIEDDLIAQREKERIQKMIAQRESSNS